MRFLRSKPFFFFFSDARHREAKREKLEAADERRKRIGSVPIVKDDERGHNPSGKEPKRTRLEKGEATLGR